LTEKERIWNAVRDAFAPMGYDASTNFSTVDDPGLGLLRLDSWRIQLEQVPAGIRKMWMTQPTSATGQRSGVRFSHTIHPADASL